MRRNVAIAIAALLVIGLVAVGIVHLVSLRSTPVAAVVKPKPSTCADAYRVLKLLPSQISAANPVCLVQSLQLSGEIVGQVAEAYTVEQDGVAPTQMCSEPKRWSGFPRALLAFVAAGKGYRLRISPPGSSEHQPVTINELSSVVELASISDLSQDWNQVTGSLSVDASGITGSIDVEALRDVSGAKPEHITGQWACGAPLPLPAFDASAPCANFYALNQLGADDVARMQANACHAQNLSFSGALSAHLDSAVTDVGMVPQAGFGGDNLCRAIGQSYEATLKFSIGDESFLLNLGADRYPSVTPGQYTARSGSSIGAVLFLGHADPSNHGAFVTDDQVYWLGRSGSFTIAGDLKSGTIDATLSGTLVNSGSTVQITGSWRCAA